MVQARNEKRVEVCGFVFMADVVSEAVDVWEYVCILLRSEERVSCYLVLVQDQLIVLYLHNRLFVTVTACEDTKESLLERQLAVL